MTNTRIFSARRAAPLAIAVVMAALLGACALEPGRPYDFSQVNGGFRNGEAHSQDAAYDANNQPTYYPR